MRHARRALDLAGPEDHFVRGAGGGFLGLAAWAGGDVQEALTTFAEAVRSLHAAGNLVDELDSTVVLADMWVAAGRPHRARRLYEQALADGDRDGEPYPRATADLHVGLAELDRELDDLAERRGTPRDRAGARRARLDHREPAPLVRRHGAGARRRPATSTPPPQLLDQAEALYRPGFYPDVRPIAAMRARVQHRRRETSPRPRSGRDEHGVTADDDADVPARVRAPHPGAAPARPPPPADRPAARPRRSTVLGAARPAPRRRRAETRAGSLLEIGMLRALTHHARGDRPAGPRRRWTRRWPRRPSRTATSRLFLDEGAPMLALLHDAASATDGEHDVLQRARPSTPRRRPPSDCHAAPDAGRGSRLADPLSERELEVLRLLDSELTGPEIARQLYVSLNTLRTHTKRIFTKLDVNNRAAAVRRGHELGPALAEPASGAAESHRRSPHVVTPGHPLAPYVPNIPRHPPRTHRNKEPDMTITPTTLTRAAGAAAVAAGLIFIGVQIGHPHLDATSVTTTEVVVRNSLKVLMAALALVGITGMYLRQVRRRRAARPDRLPACSAPATSSSCAPSFVAAFVLPAIAETDPGYVNDVLAAATNGTAIGDIGLLQTVLQVQGFGYLAGGLLFGIALYRARVLARWASALLAVGGVVTVALTVMPDAFYRLLAFPNGIAMIGLGYSLWSMTRGTATQPTRHSRPVTTAGANDPVRRPSHPAGAAAPPGVPGGSSWRVPVALVALEHLPARRRVAPAARGRRRPAGAAHQPAHRRLPGPARPARPRRRRLRRPRRVPVLRPACAAAIPLAPPRRPRARRSRPGRRRLRALDDAVLPRRTRR